MATLSTVPASAAPFGPIVTPAVPETSANSIILAQGEGRDRSNPAYQFWRYRGGGGGGNWNGGNWSGGRHWNGGNWNGGWNGRHYGHHGHYHGHNGWGWGPGLAFGLGIPLGYGLYNNYYYDRPVYRPRYYNGGSSHVEWCYNRYRSYREYDDTYQPYHGPRRHCISPYS